MALNLSDEERGRLIERFDRWSELLDGRWRIPWIGVRIGWDPIVGLVPLLGDLTMMTASLVLVNDARRLGVSTPTLLKMLGNIAIDALFGFVPIIGAIFDALFRCNERNLALLLEHMETEARQRRTRAREREAGPPR